MPAVPNSHGWNCTQAGLACIQEKEDELTLDEGLSGALPTLLVPGIHIDLPPIKNGRVLLGNLEADADMESKCVLKKPPASLLGDSTVVNIDMGIPEYHFRAARVAEEQALAMISPRPSARSALKRNHTCSGKSRSEGFSDMICAGDILNIVSRYHPLTRLGASGGFMGHVLLAVSEPQPVSAKSSIGEIFREFSGDGKNRLVRVNVVECARQRPDLSECSLILFITSEGGVFVCGEDDGDLFKYDEPEEMHIWHCPSTFRGKQNFNVDIMHQVLGDMRANSCTWSWATAVRAFLLSGELAPDADVPITLKEIQASWQVEPICSSIVVTFWQRYLHRIAEIKHDDSLELIMKHMPLKADRVLPGELLQSLLSSGWTLWQPLATAHQNEDDQKVGSRSL